MPCALALACSRQLPTALSLPGAAGEVAAAPAAAPITDAPSALAWVIRGDPLCRRPRLPTPDQLDGIAGTEALADAGETIAGLEGPGRDLIGGLRLQEDQHPGTAVVGMTRGYRLGIADRLLATWQGDLSSPELAQLAPLLTPLAPDPTLDRRMRHPLTFLTTDGQPLPQALRAYGDRWVLEGWLDGPGIPLGPIRDALAATPYDDLRASALGQLVVARADGRSGDPVAGLADLRQATALALQRAAADRHAEQGAFSDARRAAGEALGTDDPVRFLLQRAAARLTAAGADPRAAGGALVAITALRLQRTCERAPCSGLDRTATLARGEAWSDDLADVARAWRVIALKDAIDSMDVGHDTVVFERALVDLVDALAGTGAPPLRASLLTHRAPEPEVWAVLGAAVGDPTPSTWDDLRVPLGTHLADEARLALAVATDDTRPLLDRILRRAVP